MAVPCWLIFQPLRFPLAVDFHNAMIFCLFDGDAYDRGEGQLSDQGYVPPESVFY